MTTTNKTTGVPQKRRIFLRVWEPEEDDIDQKTHYYAKVGRLEVEGWGFYVDRDDVKSMLKRALKAEEPLPEKVAKAVESVVNYLVTAIQLGSATAAAHAGFDYNEREGLSFTVEIFYNDDGRWVVEVRAVNERHNGLHRLRKRVTLKQVTAEALHKIVEKVVRQAYNAYF